MKDKNFIEFIDKLEEYKYFFDEPENEYHILENVNYLIETVKNVLKNEDIEELIRTLIIDLSLTINKALLFKHSLEVSLNNALIPVVVSEMFINGYRQVGDSPLFVRKDK